MGSLDIPMVPTRPLGRTMISSVFTGLAGQAALVFSGVAAARMLTVEDRGSLALIAVVPALLVQIGTLGVPLAVTFAISRSRRNTGTVLRQVRRLALAQSAGLLVTGAIVAFVLSMGRSVEVSLAMYAALAYIPAGVASQYGLAVLQGSGEFRLFNVLRLVPSVLYAAYAFGWFLVGGADILWLVAGWLGANLVAATLTLRVVRQGHRQAKPVTDQADSRREHQPTPGLLRFGIKSLPGYLSPLDSLGADQLMVGLLLSPTALGVYVIASSVCNLPRFVAQSAGLVAFPHVASLGSPAHLRALVGLVALSGTIAAIFVIVLELSVGWIIPTFFGAVYAAAVPLTRLLLVAAFLFGIRRVMSDSLRGAGYPHDGTLAEIVAWIVLVTLLFTVGNRLNVETFALALSGAAAASVITMILRSTRRFRAAHVLARTASH